MCRSKKLGGRRCACGSTEAARQRALDNRKKNRLARRNLASYFKGQEMNETAAAVMKMNPSAIPALLDEMKIDHSVLGVEAPNANRVAQEQRKNEQIIALALKESEGKEQEQLLDTSSMDDETSTQMQEEIARGFAQFVVDNFSKKVGSSGVLLGKNYDTLDKLYPQLSKLPVPDDEEEADQFWDTFSEKIQSQVDLIHGSELSPETQRMMEVLGQAPLVDTKLKTLSNAEACEVLDVANNKGDGTYMTESILGSIRKNYSGVTLKDAGDGFYIYQYYGDTIFIYVSGPVGDRKIYKSTTDYDYESDPVIVQAKDEVPYGLGLSRLSEDEKQEMIQNGNIPAYLRSIHEGKPLEQSVDELRSETASKPHVKKDLIRDMRTNYNYHKGNTYVHQTRGTKGFPPFSVAAFRNFVAGHVLTTERTAVTKSFQELYGEKSIDIYSATPTYDEWEETEKFEKSLNEEEARLIRRYTSSGYQGYARLAVGAQLKEGDEATKQELATINNRITEFSKTIEHPRTVLRGQAAPHGMTVQGYVDSVEVGQSLVSTKLLSTSVVPHVATSNFQGQGNVLYIYHTKKGAAVTGISTHSHEQEVLLPAGTDFVCVGKSYENEQGIIYLADKDLVGD